MHKSPNAVTSIALFLAVAAVASGASAETIEVPGDFPTIQGAIESAESGDVVQIAAGLFPIRSAIDPMGKAIEIRGTSDSEGRPITRIDGSSTTRVLDVGTLETNATVFRDLVFENGGLTSFGSVVRITNASPVFETCEFRGGYAIYKAGGVLTRQNAAPIFRDCLFAENQSEIVGGAIFADDSSSLTLEGCEIRDNLAQSGAGIYVNGSATARILDSKVCDNQTPQVDGVVEDLGGNTISDTCGCDGDLDGDGMVSGVDLGVFFSFWGPCPAPCPADRNNDGVVNGTDLGTFFALWGPCP